MWLPSSGRVISVSVRSLAYMARRRCLVITADDLGYNQERDQGIFECFLNGRSITNASILANGMYGVQAAATAKEIGLPVGLHFNMTEGTPLSKKEEVKSLLDTTGYFWGKLGSRYAVEKEIYVAEEVKQELVAQINWFKAQFGTLPIHIDGHQHIHTLPIIRDVFCETLAELNIKWTRLPLDDKQEESFNSKEKNFHSSVNDASRECIGLFNKSGLRHTDHFIGSWCMGKNMSEEKIKTLLREVLCDEKFTSCELMTHPGYSCRGDGGCGRGPDDFSQSEDREHEMNVLRSPTLKEFYKNEKIELVSFKDLD